MGRARHAGHRRRARAHAASRPRLRFLHALHRRLPDRRARRAGRARREPLPLLLDTERRPDPGQLSLRVTRPGLRLRHLPGRLSLEPRDREAPGRGRAAGRCRAAHLARRLARGFRRRARRPLRQALRAPQRPALPAPQRTRRARERRKRGGEAGARALRGERRRAPPRARRLVAPKARGAVSAEAGNQRDLERWIGWIRLGAILFAIFQVSLTSGYPAGYHSAAWATTACFAAGSLLLFLLSRREWSRTEQVRLGFAALVFDFAVVSTYVLLFSWESDSPVRQVMFVPLIEASVRFGIPGALSLTVASAPVMAVFEWLRERRVEPRTYHVDYVSLQLGLEIVIGLIVGWLLLGLRAQTAVAESRAGEAERLRDELGRRADALEAANRCARALSSSLELERAFDAFIRELRGLLPFDRMAIVLSADGSAQVMAVAGAGADEVLPSGSARPTKGSLLEEVLRTNRAVYRRDMSAADYAEETEFLELGLRCRFATPLLQ